MDELLGRRTPYSAAAEQAVLGSILIDARCIPEVIDKLKPADFYIQANRDIFETVFAMFLGQTVDPVTVLDQMKVRGVSQENTEQYLKSSCSSRRRRRAMLEYAAIVRDRALLRALVRWRTRYRRWSTRARARRTARLRPRSGRSCPGQGQESRRAGACVHSGPAVYDGISEAALSEGGTPGITTGMRELDSAILGLGPGDLVLVASRPGMGKTSIGS